MGHERWGGDADCGPSRFPPQRVQRLDLCAPGHVTALWRLSFSSAPEWGHSFRSQGSQEGILASRLARTTGLMGVLCGPAVDLGEAEPGLGQWVPTPWTAEVAKGPGLALCHCWLWGSGDLNPSSPELILQVRAQSEDRAGGDTVLPTSFSNDGFPGKESTAAGGQELRMEGRWACLCDLRWPGPSRPGGPYAFDSVGSFP